MSQSNNEDIIKQVILGAREYGIASVLFRNVIAEKLGINVTDMECLGLLFHKGIATPSELSNHTGLSSGSTTAMLDRLEKTGLIIRRPNPKDRRGILIEINTSAAKKLEPFFLAGRKAQYDLVASFSEKELQLLLEFFKKSIRMWEAQREQLQKYANQK